MDVKQIKEYHKILKQGRLYQETGKVSVFLKGEREIALAIVPSEKQRMKGNRNEPGGMVIWG